MDTTARLVIDGDTLGQKHRNYNKLVNEAIRDNPAQPITAINYEDSDLENLFKIDLACNNRNVEYVLEVLKCGDMLYVSRAIKQSTWLITEEKYSSIINPIFLHNNLHRQMTSKGFNKLIRKVRLNLNDEQRVEEFFSYYKQRDLQKSFKWLLRCSIPFIENILKNHANDIPKHLLKRLYEKSFTFLEIMLRSYTATYKKDCVIQPGIFLLNKNLEKMLDIIETLSKNEDIRLGPKYTKTVIRRCPEKLMNDLDKYEYFLDIEVFAKCLRKEDVKHFILTHIQSVCTWFSYNNIKYFLNRLPHEERFNFVQKVFIEKSYKAENVDDQKWNCIVDFCNQIDCGIISLAKAKSRWYAFAPFDKGFDYLKGLIRNKKNPTDRMWIIRAMLTCAGNNQNNILTLLKYYHENHINEIFINKIEFVNHLIMNTDTHKYGNESWAYLNYLFNDLDVYTGSEDVVQSCVTTVIFYNVVHGKKVPDTIENKFDFDYYILNNKYKNTTRFNLEDGEKIFNYLYEYNISKMKDHIKNKQHFYETLDIVVKVLKLFVIWSRELVEYPLILGKIKNLTILRNEKCLSGDLSSIYNIKKSWRRLLFSVSIGLSPNQDSCINALKHDPKLLEIYRNSINLTINSNDVAFYKFLQKIRVSWYRPLSDSFCTTFLESLNQLETHKASIKGLCILLLRKKLLAFIQQYAPNKDKVAWSQTDEVQLSIRKNIAANMHLARPHPPLEVVLLYAKGDYLQRLLPSLNAIFHNISSDYIREHIADLLNTPVELQIHCIRVAFCKLNAKELKSIFSDIWKLNNNSSIRKEIFCLTYEILCTESDETIVSEIWEWFRSFIDELCFEDNKGIYAILCRTEKVPLSVRSMFLMKSYDVFRKMPRNSNRNNLIAVLEEKMIDVYEFLDADFMKNIIFENFDKMFTKPKFVYSRHIARYMLSTKHEYVQNERYEKILAPLVERAVALWNIQIDNDYYARNNLNEILAYMSTEFENFVWKKEMVFPITMYTKLLNKVQSILSTRENYILLTSIKLSLGFIQILYDFKIKFTHSEEMVELNKSNELIKLLDKSAPIFGKLCLNYLKEDVTNNFSTIYILFAHVLGLVLERYQCIEIYKYKVLQVFLDCEDFIEGYLLATKLIVPVVCYDIEEKNLRLSLMKKIRSHPSEEAAIHYHYLRKIHE